MPILLVLKHWKQSLYVVLGVAETADEDGYVVYDSIDAIFRESSYLDERPWVLSSLDQLKREFDRQEVQGVYVGSVIAAEFVKSIGWSDYRLQVALEYYTEDDVVRRLHTGAIFGRDLIHAVLHLNSTGHSYDPLDPMECIPSGRCRTCIVESKEE